MAYTSDMAFAAPIAPDAYASSTIGGKKSRVWTMAMSGVTRYTAASSLDPRPTSSSAGLACCWRGRRTCASGPGPSFAPQPAQVARVVRRTSSRVNTPVSLGTCDLRQRHGTADRRVPDAHRKSDEQHREREVLPGPPAADHLQQQEHGGTCDEREVEQQEQRQGVQMTLCSLMSSPRRNRSYASALTSSVVRPSTTSSAIASPVAGACMM